MNGPAAVTIGIRTFERPLLLERAIQSVIDQSFADWKIVLLNNGGDPAVVNGVVDKHRDRLDGRIEVIHERASRSIGAAANATIARPLGEHYILLDDDDAWEPQFLQRCVDRLRAEQNEVVAVATQFIRASERVHEDGSIEELSRRVSNPTFERTSFQNALMGCPAPPTALLIRSSALESVGRYDETLGTGDDWEFLLRLLTHGRIAVIPEPLAIRYERYDGDSRYANLSARQQTVRDDNASIRDRFTERPMRQGELDVAQVALSISEVDRENHARINETLDHVRELRIQFAEIDYRTKHILGLLERYDSTFRALRMLLRPVVWMRKSFARVRAAFSSGGDSRE
ncbi:MAG: glycosyltransferase family 2 protein [Solirubrobacterales bacterium]